MKRFRSHFVFNRSERNGIFVLVLLIIGLQAVYFFADFTSDKEVSPEMQKEMSEFQRQIDSLREIAAIEDTLTIYPFNPNFISDYRGYTLGMSVEEIDRLHAYRAGDKWVNSDLEFQQVTGISDSLLQKIRPYFRFPVFSKPVREVYNEKEKAAPRGIQDLNEATAEALMEIRGVGEVLSRRIVKYRESIGGFRDEVQLYDVYGLAPEVVERILESFKILNPLEFQKLNLNSISVLGLSEIPGFTYELARKVVTYRDDKNGFSSFEDLRNIKGFPQEQLERIHLYLTIE